MFEFAAQPFDVRYIALRTSRALTAHLHWISFVLFYVLAANMPYCIAARFLGLMPLGWFCCEYALIGVLALYLPRTVSGVLLLIAIAADILSGVSKTFYLAPTDCLTNLFAVTEFSRMRVLLIAGVLVAVGAVVTLAMSIARKPITGPGRRYAARVLLASLVFVPVADLVSKLPRMLQVARVSPAFYGTNDARQSLTVPWLGRYPAIRLVRNQMLLGLTPQSISGSFGSASPLNGASTAALQSVQTRPSGQLSVVPNIVVVLTESWGAALDPRLREALVRPYLEPGVLAGYSVTQGTTDFRGATVAGEARELCNSAIGAAIIGVSQQNFSGCLPSRLHALGYRTIALHGMDGHMFHRIDWYKRAGLEELWFRDDFSRQGLPECLGVFPGTCDSAIAGWIGTRLAQPSAQPRFLYWVTLNSHLPVPVPTVLPHPASCAITPPLVREPALCSWFQLVANVHESVATLARSSLSRPTIFVIVGDHAPPFANPDLRSQFSQDVVPWVILMPRAGFIQPAERVQLAARDQSSEGFGLIAAGTPH